MQQTFSSWLTDRFVEPRTYILHMIICDLILGLQPVLDVCQVPNTKQEVVYLTARPQMGSQLLIELRFTREVHGVACVCKSERPDFSSLLFAALRRLLS